MVKKELFVRLDECVDICKLHLRRMDFARDKMSTFLPLSVDSYYNLDDENVSFVDQFIYRFFKLQDLMGNRLFKLILDLVAEPLEGKSFIDILNRLEKLGLIDSVEAWLELRELRNELAHEYPSSLNERLQGINQLVQKAEVLARILNSCEAYSARYRN
jgi:hypothetical protein